MIRLLFSLSFFMVAAALSAGAAPAPDEAIPSPAPLDRYQEMIAKSPFAPATAVVPTVAAAAFTDNYYVSSVARIGDQDAVSIRSKDQQQTLSLFTGETSPDGISIVSVDWAENFSKSRVNVRKGSETGVLEFDQAVMAQKPAPPPAVPQAGQRPGGNVPKPMPQAARVQQAVPPPVVQPQPASAVPRPGETRRRIRIINSTP